MSGSMRQLAEWVRKIARQEAVRASPPVARYRVARKKPFTLEAFGSSDRLTDGEDGFDATALRARSKVDDTVLVLTDEHGDRVALALLRSEKEEEDETGDDEFPVKSVFGRTGAVVAQAGDYTVAQITNAASQAEVAAVAADLEAEAGARAAGDAAEAADREAADAAEAADREAADAAEEAARIAAVAAEKVAREAADKAEKEAREAADALRATKVEVAGLLAAADAMIFKGSINCAANPNYPAADAGHTYRVSAAGKIGGGAGPNVEIGDLLICIVDGSAAGTHAAVGANWTITQTNVDGAVTGPAASTSGDIATFNGVSGKVIQDSGVVISTDGTFAANSDGKLPTEKAVGTFVATQTGLLIPKSLIDAKGDLIVGEANDKPIRLAVGADGLFLTADSTQTGGLKWASAPGAVQDIKESVRACTTANVVIATALNNGDSLDGIVLATGDRVLVANQTTKSENGIWVVGAVPARATDADAAGELSGGTHLYVEEGTKYGGRVMVITTTGSVTPGTTAHEWKPLMPKDFGLVTELPTAKALVGDFCTYKAATNTRWECIYDGEGTTPWAVVNGPPLVKEAALATLETASSTFQTTNQPAITVPVLMIADLRVQCNGNSNVTEDNQLRIGLFTGSTERKTAIHRNNSHGNASMVVEDLEREVAAGVSVNLRYRSDSSKSSQFFNAQVVVAPRRIG